MAYIWEGNTFWQGRCILYNDGTHVKERDVMLCDVANNEGNDLSVLVGCLKTGFCFKAFQNWYIEAKFHLVVWYNVAVLVIQS